MLSTINSLYFATFLLILSQVTWAADSWPQWRGAQQNGFAGEGEIPLQWDEQTHVYWKTKIDGKGGSTPVVSKGTAFITSGIDGKNTLIAISMDDGKLKWTTAIGEDRGGKHRKGSGSNPSAVIKDDLVYAYFRSGDLACVDFNGKLVWEFNLQQKFAPDVLLWDLGTSPLVTDDAVVIAVMQAGPSYIAAFHPRTGDTLWKVDRNVEAPKESGDSYTTPLSVMINGKEAIAVMGADHLTIHDASDGHLMGKLGGFNPDQIQNYRSIASPVASGKIIVCPYARGKTLTAVDMEKLVSGNTQDSVLWKREEVAGDVPTPVIAGNQVILVGGEKKQRGTVTSLDLHTGKTLWSFAIPASRHDFSSSPLMVSDHVFVTAEDGSTYVIGPIQSPAPRLVHRNVLADKEPYTKASPVSVDHSLLIRTKNFLYRIGS